MSTLFVSVPLAAVFSFGLLSNGGCAGTGGPPEPPSIVEQKEYRFEMVRLKGEDPGLGQFTDIKYIGDDHFLVVGSHGFVTITPDGDQGYRVLETTPFSRPPEKLYGGQAMSLVDLDADGRYEAMTSPNVMAARVILYDDDGTYLWDHTRPPDTDVWGIDYVMPVQADADPELEVFFCYNNYGSARLIQVDGSMGPELMPDYHMPGLLTCIPLDVDEDGVDELICGPGTHVVLWSFEKGVLASVDLELGRAIEVCAKLDGRTNENQLEWGVKRLDKRGRPGWSKLYLARGEDGVWRFDVSEFKRFQDEPWPYEDYAPQTSLIRRDEGLWIRWDRIDHQRSGVGLADMDLRITVGSSKHGLVYRDMLESEFYPKIGEGAGTLKTDSDAVVEAWFVWVNGVWRLRIQKE